MKSSVRILPGFVVFLFSNVVAVTVHAATYAETVLSDTPIAYYRFNSDTVPVANNIGSLGAAAGGIYTGTAAPGAEAPRPPAFPTMEADNTALQLDGVSAFVTTIPGLLNGKKVFTITGWIRRAADQGNRTGLWGQNDLVEFGYINNDTLEVWTDNGLDISPNPIPNEEWAHLAIVSTGSPGTMTMYTNGVVAGSRNHTLPLDNTFAFNIGGGGVFDGTGNFFNGQIDEVAIFDKALSAERIAFHYFSSVAKPPTITSQPQAANVFEGADVILTVGASGSPPLKYQWLNFSAPILNETNSSLVFSNITIDEGGLYQVEVSNGFGTVLSDAAEVIVSPTTAPSIVQQPASITRYAGAPVRLTVTATGGSRLQYRWQKGGADVPNATNAALVFSSVAAGDAGDYKVIVSNSAGSTTSDPATLTVISPPPGSYAEAIVKAGPIAYWRFNEPNGVAPTTAFDYYGGHDAAYVAATTGDEAPRSPQFPGFEANNLAAQFDGTSGYVNGPVGLMNGLNTFSMVGWIRRGGDQANRTGLFGQNDIVEFGYINNNTLELWTDNGLDVSPNPFPNEEWAHVALTADGSPGTARMYTNGVLAGSRAQSLPGPNNFAFNIGGGGVFDATGNFFTGQIDEMAVYDKALTADQICALYSRATGQPVVMSIARGGNILLDSKPTGVKHNAANFGPNWVAEDTALDLVTRQGVMQFIAARNDQIILQPSTDFDSAQGSITFWMRSSGTTGAGNFGGMLVDRRSDRGDVIVQADDGTIFVQATDGGGVVNSFSSSGTVSDGFWHHVAYVYDQAGSTTVYLDGLQAGTQVTTRPWSWNPTQRIELGRSHDGYWKLFEGSMDDFRIYNRMLTADEILGMSNGDGLVDPAALKVRLNFDAPPYGITLGWSCGKLQSTDVLVDSGPGTIWTDVPNAAPPFVIDPQAAAGRFFRATY